MRIAAIVFALVLLGDIPKGRSEENGLSRPTEFIANAFLSAHNAVRAEVGVPPLAWSANLAQYAQQWANQLASAGRLYHRSKNIYGENLYLISGGQADPQQVIAAWAAEEADYDLRTNSCRSRCGHYTQLVWRDTKQIGCAMTRAGRVEVWVCNYNPPGNYVGERPY